MARNSKVSLRQFQESVVAKLQAMAQGGEAKPASKLGMLVGPHYWLVDLADAGEVIPPPEIVPVPLTQPWFCGAANVRGNLYSVVDFSAFCGGEPVVANSDRRLILANSRFSVNSGLLISRLLGLRHPEQLQARELTPGAPPWVKAEYNDSDGHHWQELNIQALVNDPDFLQVGR
jgi:twitching motility protein PilI